MLGSRLRIFAISISEFINFVNYFKTSLHVQTINIVRPILQLLSMHSGTCNPRDNARRTEKKIKYVVALTKLYQNVQLFILNAAVFKYSLHKVRETILH